MTVKDHYDKHLGNFYSWMAGDIDQRQRDEQKIFQELGINDGAGLMAVDLGAGYGIQSIALANLGYRVKAVDFNRQLLEELSVNRKSLPISLHQQDLLEFMEDNDQLVDLVVCMGDTITHLPSINDADHLFALVKKRLNLSGKFVISFRDLSVELKGNARLIPVKQDNHKILTCFLEYLADHVLVHDLLWERTEAGWIQRVSAYPKLKLSEEMVSKKLAESGLRVTRSVVRNGMQFLIAQHTQASTQ